MSNEIIPVNLAIRAMRDSGYKTTAHAIAELIDNSVQADAKTVEVICIEEPKQVVERTTLQLTAIGVLDNGCGMDSDILTNALQFGNGTHLTDRSGIGRFGMGLPNSSISQCRRVEVWTWQSGIDNALYSYLDVSEIENEDQLTVPKPIPKQVPQRYIENAIDLAESGTLVLWTDFSENRHNWKQARTTFERTEYLIGRMYRKFIESGKASIRMLAISDGKISFDRLVRVNDPLYLSAESSTPDPFKNKPMFEPWGESDEEFKIMYDGKLSTITVRVSIARNETLPEDNTDRGNKEYGKHAKENIGVSIVREGRELDLDSGWTISYDPVERWWGIEVEFPSTLDEVFGVTNNKQSATNFSQLANYNWRKEAEQGESFTEFRDRILSLGDQKAHLFQVVEHINMQLTQVRKRLKEQAIGRRSQKRGAEDPNNDDRASKIFKDRADDGYEVDIDKEIPTENDHDTIVDVLVKDKNIGEKDAEKIADTIVQREQKVKFFSTPLDGYAFFHVGYIQGGITTIDFNMNHPLYEQLIESLNLESKSENGTELMSRNDETDLKERIIRAADTLELLFAAWARYEIEEMGTKDKFFEFRQEWGKMAKYFLSERDDDN